MLRTLQDHGINWIWYLQGVFDEDTKTVEILCHDRFHKGEDRHPKSEGATFRIGSMDPTGRIAQTIKVYGRDNSVTEYTVTNPQNVFAYRDRSRLEMEA